MLNIQENISLKPYTTFKIGGPARFFCKPQNSDEVIEALSFAQANNLAVLVIGLGANILFSDSGFDGLVIRQSSEEISLKDNIVKARSGVTLENLINVALANNLLGLEDFSGIPSTVGGALYINLHYYNSFIGPTVRAAIVLDKDTNMIEKVDQDWFGFSYDESRLKIERKHILLEADFELQRVNDYEKYEAIGKSKEIIRTRQYKYPSEPSVGSIFQNLNLDEQKQYGLPTRSVAYLIDVCGLKGKRVGEALLSHRHSNIIVNTGDARAADVLELAELIRYNVKDKFGIDLRFEIQLIGF